MFVCEGGGKKEKSKTMAVGKKEKEEEEASPFMHEASFLSYFLLIDGNNDEKECLSDGVTCLF